MKIFVVGCGRTGTCLMGKILASHPAIEGFIEDKRFFPLATEIATNPGAREPCLPELLNRYRRAAEEVAPLHFADKSHPNLWQVEALADAFPDARFIAMRRDVEPTVASMLKHNAFSQRTKVWESFGVPNPFLGITEENKEWYMGLSDHEKFAVRWRSHRDEILRLWNVLPGRFETVMYDNLVRFPVRATSALKSFLGLNEEFPIPDVYTSSIDRWRGELSLQQLEEIRAIGGGET